MKRVLVTGGAGFIGSHVADALLGKGYAVRVLDNLSPQVHLNGSRPGYLSPEAELVIGDIRDADQVAKSLDDIDAVIHLAAAVGVGQSMYQIAAYTSVNDLGSAVLLEALAKRPVERLVCASSMSVYGEGLAMRKSGEIVSPADRPIDQLRRGAWELEDDDGSPLTPVPTPENKIPSLNSIYALGKYVQERMCLIAAQAYDIPAVALRFFNVYGPRQALSNPYTGVLAIFAARLLHDRPPLIFEDGCQKRDFIHVRDVAKACILSLEAVSTIGVLNIGSGVSRTVVSIAEDLARVMGKECIRPHIVGKYRAGDIRHCFASIARAETVLGFRPTVEFAEGLGELAAWLSGEQAQDNIDIATAELEKRGLVA